MVVRYKSPEYRLRSWFASLLVAYLSLLDLTQEYPELAFYNAVPWKGNSAESVIRVRKIACLSAVHVSGTSMLRLPIRCPWKA